jgi:ribosomal protein S2
MHNNLQNTLQYFLQIGTNNKKYTKKNTTSNRNKLYLFHNTQRCIETITDTIYTTKKYLTLISSVLNKGGTLLVYINNLECAAYLAKNRNKHLLNMYTLFVNWFPGILTNRKFLVARAKKLIHNYIILKKKIDNKYMQWESVSNLTYLPQLAYLLSEKKAIIKESNLINIPYIVIGFIKTDHTNYIKGTENRLWNLLMYSAILSRIAENSLYARFKYE